MVVDAAGRRLFSDAFWTDPGSVSSWWRDHYPVHFHEDGGFWTLARHADVLRACTDTDTFSNEGIRLISVGRAKIDEASFEAQVHMRRLSSRDKPSHTELRRLMSKPFNPRSVAQLAERVGDICHTLVDEMASRRHFDDVDLVRDLAYPLPVLAVNLILGVPDDVRWSIGRYSNTTEREMAEYFRTLVQQPRFETGDDLTSELVRAAAGGNRYIEPEEVHYFVAAFWTAGNLTTTNLLAHMLVLLQHLPGVREELEGDRSLIPPFVEECLRVEPPVPGVFRIARKDITFGDVTIREGSKVFLLFAAANRDPEVFEDPDHFVLRRQPNPHLSFAHGIHVCLGAPLARLEARLAVETLLDRGIDYDVQAERTADNRPGNTLNGYLRLPATLHTRH